MKRYDEPFLLYQKNKMLLDEHDKLYLIDVERFLRKNFDKEFTSIDNLNAEFNLFLWSVLSYRIEIAKVFWRLGRVSIFYLKLI